MKSPEHEGVRLHCVIHTLQAGTATGASVCSAHLFVHKPLWLYIISTVINFHPFDSFLSRLLSLCSRLYTFVLPNSSHTSPSLSVHSSVPLSPLLQCIRQIAHLLLQNQPSLQQPALKLMSESGDEQLLQLTLDQINSMSAVSVTVKKNIYVYLNKSTPSHVHTHNKQTPLHGE